MMSLGSTRPLEWMLWKAVPDLIDHPLRRQDEEAIAQLLFKQGVHAEELVAMRSRRSGR